MLLVKLCSLGIESREGNLNLATILTPTSVRTLYLYLGFVVNRLPFPTSLPHPSPRHNPCFLSKGNFQKGRL